MLNALTEVSLIIVNTIMLYRNCSHNAPSEEKSEINIVYAEPLKPLTSGLGESGYSYHCASKSTDVEKVRPAGKDSVTVVLPRVAPITSAHIGIYKFNKLPLQARTCHIFPDMCNKTLMSLSKLCDCGIMMTLTKT